MRRVSDMRRMYDKASMWYDPDRWEDADMQRNAWIRWAAGALVLAVVITVVVIAAGILVSSATAREVCLHRDDFRTVDRSLVNGEPMSRWQVHQLFGMTGRDIGWNTRAYEGCGEGSRAWLQFKRDDDDVYRVVSSAFTMLYFGDGLVTNHPARQAR